MESIARIVIAGVFVVVFLWMDEIGRATLGGAFVGFAGALLVRGLERAADREEGRRAQWLEFLQDAERRDGDAGEW